MRLYMYNIAKYEVLISNAEKPMAHVFIVRQTHRQARN